jgi:hypothetical protein
MDRRDEVNGLLAIAKAPENGWKQKQEGKKSIRSISI